MSTVECSVERFGFIRNSRAKDGGNALAVESAIGAVRAAGHEAKSYECPSNPAEPVARAIADGCSVIVACGGDGTVSGVAGAMYRSGATLAVLPLGTLNHFAADLGLLDLRTAERTLTEGHPRAIDAASVNGRLFINNSGIGVYPAIVMEREAVRKQGIPKWPALAVGLFRTMAKIPFVRLRLVANETEVNHVTPFLFIGNNAYEMEGFGLGRRARLDEGQLVVCSAQRAGSLGLMRIALRALFGSLRQERDFIVLRTAKLTVRSGRRHLHVSVDGEIQRMQTPLEYLSLPGALTVLAP